MNQQQQVAFQAGYQAALDDIATALERGGVDDVQQWLTDNLHRRLDGPVDDRKGQ